MKICLFSDARSVHVQRIAAGLAARNAEVHIVTYKPAEVPGASVERFRIPAVRLTNPRRWQGRWAHYLRSFMKQYDIVHVHFLHDWGFTPEIMHEGCFVATPWGSDIVPPPGEGSAPSAAIAARVTMLRHAACVTAWGRFLAEATAELAGIDADAIHRLPLGVDLLLFRPMPTSPRPENAPQRVGFFKGFRAVYGPTYLMRAIPTVVEELPNTRFQLLGDGPMLEDCKVLAGRYGVQSHVTWIRRQPHANLPNYLAGWDLTVIPSLCESFGVAALESSAMKVPVVASNVGGLPETVHDDETGWLVPPASPEHLADAIITLLRDEPRRRAMGESGRSMVRRAYDWAVILDQWMETYAAVRDHACVMV